MVNLKKLGIETLRGQTQFWAIVLVVLPSLLGLLLFGVYEREHIRLDKQQQLQQTISAERKNVETWFDEQLSELKSVAEMPAVRAHKVKKMTVVFKVFSESHVEFDFLNYSDKTGVVEASSLPAGAVGQNIGNLNFFQQALSGKTAASEVFVDHFLGEPVMAVAMPVFDKDGSVQGVVYGYIKMATIYKAMRQSSFDKTGEIFLTDINGRMITTSRFIRAAENSGDAASTQLYQTNNVFYHKHINSDAAVSYNSYRGDKVLGISQWIDKMHCMMVAEIDEQEILEPYYHQLGIMSCGILLILAASLPFAVLFARRVKKSHNYLLRGSENFAEGKYDYTIDTTALMEEPREIVELCTTFNMMGQKIKKHQLELESRVKERTAELANVNQKLRQEIAERNIVESTLKERQEEIINILESISDGFYVLNEICQVIYMNQAAEDISANFGDKCMNQKMFEKPIIFVDTAFYDAYLKAREKHIVVCAEGKSAVLNKWIEVNIYPQGKNMVVYFRDIGQRKQMEQEMQHLGQLHMVGEMAASIGHEVRNPMTTVRGFLQMLRNKEDCRQYHEYFDIMIGEIDRANAIITEFLSLAKNKTIKLEVCSLNKIIYGLAPLIQASGLLVNKYLKLNLQEVPDIKLDANEIRQLILNLARNGLEAMNSGGYLQISTFMQDNQVILAIKDQGSGIPPEIMDKIGKPFFTTKEQGVGLGLAVCYSIAARHQAEIKVETGLQGTTFYVSFTV